MTHEFREIIEAFKKAKKQGINCVLATVVDLQGSSYRKPGVRMLLEQTGKMTGAVSGGCVEKEVWRQALEVFASGEPRMMIYDGRYRLGCEGTLFILIEPFNLSDKDLDDMLFIVKSRKPFQINSCYTHEIQINPYLGSKLVFNERVIEFRKNVTFGKKSKLFSQKLMPEINLLIVGAEHDALHLIKQASLLGWDICLITHPSDPRKIEDFKGIRKLLHILPEQLDTSIVDEYTAAVLMTHNYVKDLAFLEKLLPTKLFYLGVLGAVNRRERLINDVLERNPIIEEDIFESIYAPAGIDIGSVTPQEIALAISSEILAVINNRNPIHLSAKTGKIHS